MASGEFVEAGKLIQHGLEQCPRLDVSQNANVDQVDTSAYLHYRLGQCLAARLSLPEAVEHWNIAGKTWWILQKQGTPQTARYLRWIADCALEMARSVDFPDQPPWFREALEELDAYCLRHQNDLAMAKRRGTRWSRLANRTRRTASLDLAASQYRKAAAAWQALLDADPTNAKWQSELGAIWNNLAFVEIKRGNPDDAWESIQKAIPLQQRALQSDPGHRTYRRFLANHYAVATQIRLMLDDPESAAEFAVRQGELAPQSIGTQMRAARDLCRCIMVARSADDPARIELAERLADQAIVFLNRALESGLPDAQRLTDDKVFSVLAEHPEFQELVRRIEGS